VIKLQNTRLWIAFDSSVNDWWSKYLAGSVTRTDNNVKTYSPKPLRFMTLSLNLLTSAYKLNKNGYYILKL